MDLVCQIGAVSDLKYTGVKEKDWYVKEAADAMAAGKSDLCREIQCA